MCNNARPPEPLLIDYDALNAEIAGDLNAIHAALPIAYAMLVRGSCCCVRLSVTVASDDDVV